MNAATRTAAFVFFAERCHTTQTSKISAKLSAASLEWSLGVTGTSYVIPNIRRSKTHHYR
jgi:hypothetical protein